MDWLLKLLSPKVPVAENPGVVEDPRSPEEKLKDYKFEETVASSAPVTWIDKDPSTWRKFPIRDQDGSSSCVAQALAKLLGVMYQENKGEFIDFSAAYIYKRRKNKDWVSGKEGMWGTDSFDIVREHGAGLEIFMPSQLLNEAQINAVPEKPSYVDIAKVFGIGNYVQFRPKQDFETIASTIQQTGKSVMVWFRFDYDEWTDVPFLKANSGLRVHHAVAAVDYTLHNGKKALIIEDSWGKRYGMGGQRIITEDFYSARNTFGAYPINFKFLGEEVQPGLPKPSHTFNTTLRFSAAYHENDDVRALQEILKYEGLFPKNISSTGYYGAITAKSVLAWQKKHQVAPVAELDQLQGRVVGPKTTHKLNSLYGS